MKSMKNIPALNECAPGIAPSEYNVLIIPEDTETVTAGGIILSAQTKDMNDISTVYGRLLAVSPHAFTYVSDWPEGTMPQVGDVVLYAKYAGTLVTGADGKEYRLCKDKDVAAVVNTQNA